VFVISFYQDKANAMEGDSDLYGHAEPCRKRKKKKKGRFHAIFFFFPQFF
jgi:hypothetical protein